MLREERHYYILEHLRSEGRVQTLDLSRTLQVSEDTLRRDLRDLAAAGKLQRVHGGALPRSPAVGSVAERETQSAQPKQALATAAARLLQDGQVILLDGGSTNLQVARSLPRTLKATIVTSSPAIVIGTPLWKTTSAASGSTRMLNSAAGVQLPKSIPPPMR